MSQVYRAHESMSRFRKDRALIEEYSLKNNNNKSSEFDFLQVFLKFYLAPFRNIFGTSSALGSCHLTSSRHGISKNLNLRGVPSISQGVSNI